jgi:hypothetical protein
MGRPISATARAGRKSVPQRAEYRRPPVAPLPVPDQPTFACVLRGGVHRVCVPNIALLRIVGQRRISTELSSVQLMICNYLDHGKVVIETHVTLNLQCDLCTSSDALIRNAEPTVAETLLIYCSYSGAYCTCQSSSNVLNLQCVIKSFILAMASVLNLTCSYVQVLC